MASRSYNGSPSFPVLRIHEEGGSEGHAFSDLHSVHNVLEEEIKAA